ncbi:metallophosphoesterase [Erwinia sp. BNK-24-b]|uniref:metallophosphoesterase n=1 Tax=unclassified Erwinia TaxID=2622719 RepID=UPI0039BEE02F
MSETRRRAVEIVQITDLHLMANERLLLKGVNTAQTLNSVLTAIGQTSYHRLIATGDISEDFSAASYETFKTLLARHRIASLVCLSGNHDDPVMMQEILGPVALPRIFCEGEWLFIGLNTTIKGEDEGEIAAVELAQLDSLLAQHHAKFAAIFMHHHALPVQSGWIDRYGLKNAADLLALVARYPEIKAVIGGHVHQASVQTCKGTLFYTTPATSIQFAPLSEKAEVSATPPAWRKWYFWPDGRISDEIFFVSGSD